MSVLDFGLLDKRGRLTAVVEVKNKLGASRQWAAELRRNILAHGDVPRAEFFIVALPDRLFVWKESSASAALAPPTYEVDGERVFGPIFRRTRVKPDTVSTPAFDLVVATWLGELVNFGAEMQREHPWLEESGLLAAARGGRVQYEAAA